MLGLPRHSMMMMMMMIYLTSFSPPEGHLTCCPLYGPQFKAEAARFRAYYRHLQQRRRR
jgi:hypothetical protein